MSLSMIDCNNHYNLVTKNKKIWLFIKDSVLNAHILFIIMLPFYCSKVLIVFVFMCIPMFFR